MPDKQSPIRSGFTAATTAAEILEGRDLSNFTAIVTGGHSGLGLETTRALTGAGARVIVAARNVQAAREKLSDMTNIEIEKLDLADLASIHRFAQRFLESHRHIDILIGSAAIMACPETRVGPGWEAQFATNHLGHYALINLLWPALKGGSRVVAVSSAGHHWSDIRWDDLHFDDGYDKWLAYGQSKTAVALLALQLDQLGQKDGVRAFSVHPGKILTPLQRHLPQEEMIAAGWLDQNGAPTADPSFKTPQQGAATQVWAATSPQLDGKGGLYCEDCDIAALDEGEQSSLVGVRPYAADRQQAKRLWALSAQLTGVNSFEASNER
ncbi:SDR family NAD(P)-dependent oxidoreductase [Halopseudomonas pelagia]|uniref:SDR family NAD(P)-dependent oxidoreductase n=1 Tax=Halopseudomonas pelagia TaxID=553151 RepID=UPI0030DD7E5F